MTKDITLFIGTDYDRNQIPIRQRARKVRGILDKAAREFGGYSCHTVVGAYVHTDGQITSEKALRLNLITDKPVGDFARWAKSVLNQESILITEWPVTTFMS
jgi:hypothetical protein